MISVYVLELEDNKFYIGKTNNISRRFEDHKSSNSRSATWTRKFKPVRIIESYDNADGLDEDRITLEYMIKYGIDNVRGGPYVACDIDSSREHIEHRIRMACDRCKNCGSKFHFLRNCPKNNRIKVKNSKLKVKCESCGSAHHFTEDCSPD